MTNSSFGNQSNFANELSQLNDNLRRLFNAILGRVFDFQPKSAAQRQRYLVLLLLASGFIISLRYYPLTLWGRYIQDIFLYLFNPTYRATYVGDPFTFFILFGLSTVFDPRSFQYLPIFLASFFIALQCAAAYLADIFELEDVAIARSFIWGVALSGSNETIRITEGYIAEKSRQSPVFLIGGPGRVTVDLDSLVLFEKPDGTPHIIGPTGKKPGGSETLDGFERFRAAINLRDHFTTLQEMEKAARFVKSRSLDGIRVSAVDVQIITSIFRDNQKPTDDNRFPYSQNSFEQLVYKSASKVTRDSAHPSVHSFLWEVIPPSMVRGELIKFMSGKNLTEFLASFGSPEVDQAKERENAIAREALRITPRNEDTPKPGHVDPSPAFTARPIISSLFNDFANEFNQNANKRGVEFRWTGVGTWRTIDIVPERHVGAWKLINENMFRGKEKFIESKGKEAGLSKIVAMIQDVPLAHLGRIESVPDRSAAIRLLLEEYQRQLKDVNEFLRKNGRRIPPTLVAALAYLFQIFTPSRVISSIPSPETEREEQLNEELLNKIGDCNGVILYNVMDQLVQLERRFDPDATREELLEKINRDWDLDIEGKWQP